MSSNLSSEHQENMTFNNSNIFLQNDGSDLAMTITGPSLVLASSIGCLILLNTFLKDLHRNMKTTLIVLAIHNIITSILSLSILCYMHAYQDQSLFTCTLMVQTVFPSWCITNENISFLSFLRYHIAWKTSNLEVARDYKLYLMLACIIFSEHSYGPLAYFLSITFGLPMGAGACSGEDLTGPPVIPLFHAIKIISIFVIGLFYDIMLIAFIQKRNRSVSPNHTRLVPWKSGRQEVKDITVPLHASFANATCISIAIAFAVSLITQYQANNGSSWKYFIFTFNITNSFQMPMLLGLTLRAAKQKKPPPVIPHKPHFHNDPYLEDSSSDSQNRTPEPNVQSGGESSRNNHILNVMPNSNVIHVQPANLEGYYYLTPTLPNANLDANH